jgi:hypothetical protein
MRVKGQSNNVAPIGYLFSAIEQLLMSLMDAIKDAD